MLFCYLLIFLQNHLFDKKTSSIPSECQTVRIQIRPDNMPGLIWVRTVCKSCQQTKLVGKELINSSLNQISAVPTFHSSLLKRRKNNMTPHCSKGCQHMGEARIQFLTAAFSTHRKHTKFLTADVWAIL